MEQKYFGTYSIRSIGHGEMGIHMPGVFTGDYSIFADPKGNEIRLVKQGEKSG